MSDASATPAKKGGWLKAVIVGAAGLFGGGAATYMTAVVDKVVKPNKPLANFSISADGLTVTCQNRATGESGWWDFGDGTPLEPFGPQQDSLAHTYAKPGNYSVKLVVRNFLSDENERSVPVEVAAPAAAVPIPTVTALKVQPVGPAAVAPATFRITGEVANAAGCIWDFGEGRLEVADPAPTIDRMVTFDKPGTHTIQLVSYSGKQAVKQTATVKVDQPQTGSLTAVVKVTDTGVRVHQTTVVEAVAVPVPTARPQTPRFEKAVNARPGHAITEAALVSATVPGVQNLRAEVAADKGSVKVSGEWAGDPKTVSKAAGGSDVIVRLKLTEEKSVPLPPAVTNVTGPLAVTAVGQPASVSLPLPPAPLGLTGFKREIQVEIQQLGANGSYQVAARGSLTGRNQTVTPLSDAARLPAGYTQSATAQEVGNVVKVNYQMSGGR